MKLLISQGADVNHKNKTGSTPLHAASLNGYGEAMEILVEHGPFPFTLLYLSWFVAEYFTSPRILN
jgi:ankyrin repeat protein